MGVFPAFNEITAIETSGLYPHGEHRKVQEGIGVPGTGDFFGSGWLGDMIRVDIDYILEIWDQGKIVTATVLPQVPSSIKAKRQAATSINYTLGVEPIRHHARNRRVDIEIRGKTGVASRQGYSRNGKLITKAPLELMLEFDAFLDKFQQIATRSGANKYMYPEGLSNVSDDQPFGSNGAYLVLRCLEERLHVKVEPLVWEWDRNAERTRKGSDWSLTLQAYAPTTPEKPGGLFGKGQGYIDAATAYVAAVNNCIAVGNAFMDQTSQGIYGLREPFRELVKTGTALRKLLHTGGQIADFPRALAADVLMAAGQFYAAAKEAVLIGQALEASYGGLGMGGFNDKGHRTIEAAAEETYIFGKGVFGAAGLGPDTAATYEAAHENKISGEISPSATDAPVYATGSADLDIDFGDAGDIVVHIMVDGKPLPDVVKDYYNTPGALNLVLKYNDLQDPYTWKTGAPLKPGDQIILPGTGLSAGGMLYDKNGDVENMYGKDLLLDSTTMDFVVDGNATDAKTIRGPENLEQALRLRVTTPLGTSRNFPRYGVPFVPGDLISGNMLGYLGAHLNEQMRRDRRVAGIQNLVLLDDGDTLRVSFDALAEIGTQMPVVAPIG